MGHGVHGDGESPEVGGNQRASYARTGPRTGRIWSSCLVIQLQDQGLRRERLRAHGANRAELCQERKKAPGCGGLVVGVMGMVLRGAFLIGGYWEVVGAAAQLPEGPILAEQEMNLSAC